MTKNGIRDKYGCKKGQENYLDAIDSVLWLCNTIFKPETNIMMAYVTVETGLNEVKDHNSFVVMPNGCNISVKILQDEFFADICRKAEPNLCKKVYMEASPKFKIVGCWILFLCRGLIKTIPTLNMKLFVDIFIMQRVTILHMLGLIKDLKIGRFVMMTMKFV